MKSLVVFVLSVLLLFCSPQCFSQFHGDEFIKRTCKLTPIPEKCYNYLKSDPRSFNADVKGLGLIALELSLANATDTFHYIEELLKNATDPLVQEHLNFCHNSYDEILINCIRPAIKALALYNSYDNAIMGAAYTYENADECEEVFNRPIPRPSPLTARNNYLDDVAHVALEVIGILKKGLVVAPSPSPN